MPVPLEHHDRLANHSTYHRGQVALMVRQLGGKPLATDFHVFLVKAAGVRLQSSPPGI